MCMNNKITIKATAIFVKTWVYSTSVFIVMTGGETVIKEAMATGPILAFFYVFQDRHGKRQPSNTLHINCISQSLQ